MKVLIADDSAFMRTILKASLKDVPDLEFMEAENGDVAVELYRNYRFAIVFLDIIMPVKNGIMALEEIRQINPAAKVIIVSSVSQDEMIEKAKSLKANEFLAKPFQPAQIKDVFLRVSAEPVDATVAPVAPEPAVVAAEEKPLPPATPVVPQIALDTSAFIVTPTTPAQPAPAVQQPMVAQPAFASAPNSAPVAPVVPAVVEAAPAVVSPVATSPVVAPLAEATPSVPVPEVVQPLPVVPAITEVAPVQQQVVTPPAAVAAATAPSQDPKFPQTTLFNR